MWTVLEQKILEPARNFFFLIRLGMKFFFSFFFFLLQQKPWENFHKRTCISLGISSIKRVSEKTELKSITLNFFSFIWWLLKMKSMTWKMVDFQNPIETVFSHGSSKSLYNSQFNPKTNIRSNSNIDEKHSYAEWTQRKKKWAAPRA